MNERRHARRGLTAALAVATTTTALTASAGVAGASGAVGSTAARAGVCEGIALCQVVAHKDVDGDTLRDHVGFVPRRDRGVLRVATATGALLRKAVDTRFWAPDGRGEWLGAARIDGRHGVELVVGTSRGAHAMLFTVVTYRDGRLVRESVPGPGDEWLVDASIASFAGVWRRLVDDRAVVNLKSAERVDATRQYRGLNRRFVWRHGAWQPAGTVHTTYPGPRRAGEIAGWHVRGLPTFPAGTP